MVAALAEFSEAYQKMFLDHAGHYNLYIIGDSQPVFEQGGQIYHVAHFFNLYGNDYTQPKLHITPKEVRL